MCCRGLYSTDTYGAAIAGAMKILMRFPCKIISVEVWLCQTIQPLLYP